MKPSRNAFAGYSYQQTVSFLLLCKMDSERQLSKIEIEMPEQHNFEDLVLYDGKEKVFCQIKDIDNISLQDITLESENVRIQSKVHKLSPDRNIIFFKRIAIVPNSQILGFDAYRIGAKTFIVSISREEALLKVEGCYPRNLSRVSQINVFFSRCLDERMFSISRRHLPMVSVFPIELDEMSFRLNVDWIEVKDKLLIEGKPGIGKSHLVASIMDKFPEAIVYRFWINSQDSNYRSRLQFDDFIFDLSKKIFGDYKTRTESQIIDHLSRLDSIVIVDGLDHVKNYHHEDLDSYLTFLELLSAKVRVIVITRPIGVFLDWPKKQMQHWDEKLSTDILDRVFHIDDYKIRQSIHKNTNGYPLLIRYYAEQYRKTGIVPSDKLTGDIEKYYENLFNDLQIRSCLAIFLTNRAYFSFTEIEEILGPDLGQMLRELIASRPYLFEIRLNRVSLFHDSFDTFVRNKGVDLKKLQQKVNTIVYESLMGLNRQFFGRMSTFDLDHFQENELVRKYSSITTFHDLVAGTIDYEGLTSHYQQIHEALSRLPPDNLNVYQYYDLVLILNILGRDNISSEFSFMFVYCKSLIFHGYTEKDISSSGNLFSMFYFLQTGDNNLLRHFFLSNHYDLERFENNFYNDIKLEENYFNFEKKKIRLTRPLKESLVGNSQYSTDQILEYLLVNIYLNDTEEQDLIPLRSIIVAYLIGEKKHAVEELSSFLIKFEIKPNNIGYTLEKAERKINSLGRNREIDNYSNVSLHDFVLRLRSRGSFCLSIEVLTYLRLYLHKKKKIDIESIYLFWFYYNERKDYSVVSLPNALSAFERKMFINTEKSLKIITRFQKLSEKGIRHILEEYIELSPPKIISTIESTFMVEDLEITWFSLPSEYINQFTLSTFRIGMRQLLSNSSYEKAIDFEDIRPVLNSRWGNHCAEVISALDYNVKLEEALEVPFILTNNRIPVQKVQVDNISKDQTPSEKHLQEGILDHNDIGYIKEKGLTPEEVAKTLNNDFSALSDISLFLHFPKGRIASDLEKILHGALCCKISYIGYFGRLYEMVGNVPTLLEKFEIQIDLLRIYRSFQLFLQISLCSEIDEL